MDGDRADRALSQWILPGALVLGGVAMLLAKYLLIAIPFLLIGGFMLVSRWLQLRRPPSAGE
jgi:hypothetical protein